ncbi:RibD family protein [Sphingomonas sp. ac-8]|uniref:RibD family protein n=1 Tax=Sphingomonas sp. ac-8 TaxID=3242977 RepID=UPI003A80F58C
MTDRPRIICLMTSSLDGRLHPSRYTASPDGTREDWSTAYEAIHDAAQADGWIVGRTTMAEMAKGEPHPPAYVDSPARPHHVARREGPFAIALDRSGKLHFTKPEIDGDHVVVLLGPDVPDSHLAELAEDGVSYFVAQDEDMALAPLMRTLVRELGVETLMLEGGGHVNGSFLAAGLVDELHVVVAPALDGAPNTAIVEAGEDGLKGKARLSLAGCDRLDGGAVHLRYTVTAG